MKNYNHSGKFRALAVAVVVLLALTIFTAGAGGNSAGGALGFITAPLQSVSSSVMRAIGDALGVNDYSAEFLALQEENRQLRAQLVDYFEVKRQNEQYASILELKERNPDFRFVPAAVIGRDANDLYGGFTIDQGSLHDVSVNDPVITSDGVIGVVTEVYPTTSRVRSIHSPELAISAVSQEFRESGVTASDIYTTEMGLVRLEYLTRDTKLTTGTIITTSGLSGIFPRGLVLGYVTQVAASEYDASYYALVQPYADVRSVPDVFVITSFEGQGQAAENLFTDEPVSSLPAENGTASSGDDSGSSESGGHGE